MCVLLGSLQKTWANPIMNPLSWFMIMISIIFKDLKNIHAQVSVTSLMLAADC